MFVKYKIAVFPDFLNAYCTSLEKWSISNSFQAFVKKIFIDP